MASNSRVRGVTVDQLLGALIDGVNEAFPSGSSLAIDGVTYDMAGLEQKLQEVFLPYKTADELRTQYRNAVKAREAADPDAQDFVEKVANGLQYLFGSDPNLLASSGCRRRRRSAS